MAKSWCTDAVACVALVAVIWRLLPEPAGREASPEYSAFIDHYPMTRSEWDLMMRDAFGQRPPALPKLLARFDWLIDHYSCRWMEDVLVHPTYRAMMRRQGGTPDHRRPGPPRAVWASPSALREVLESARAGFDAASSDRILVLGGADDLLSFTFGRSEQERQRTVAALRKYFSAIFYEAKDVEVEGVGTLPIGLLEMYMRRGRAEALAAAAATASTAAAAKDRQVLAAFSTLGFSRASPPNFSDAGVQARHERGFRDRLAALEWAESPAGLAAGAEVRRIGTGAYFGELARYRFALSPLGAGLQTPKTVEALLVLTVPVVPRGPAVDDLLRLGFPLAAVDAWEDVRPQRLEHWWRALAPRLPSFRKHCLTTDAYWRILTGLSPHCA